MLELFSTKNESLRVTASQSLGNPERKNTPCIFDLAGLRLAEVASATQAGVDFFLKKEGCFSFGVAEALRGGGGAFSERTILVRATTRSMRGTSIGILLEMSPNFLV